MHLHFYCTFIVHCIEFPNTLKLKLLFWALYLGILLLGNMILCNYDHLEILIRNGKFIFSLSRYHCKIIVIFIYRKHYFYIQVLYFPGSSAGKESTCNVKNPSSIAGSGRSPEEGTGYPLQYSWVGLVAQMVKNLPAMQETWVQSLSWDDPWRKAWQPTPVYLHEESPWTEVSGGL